ncbi:2-carboxy-1,4-naphthoquinone phytyltransferase, chloroplastic-like [Primulina huaijiensis]|uniref:2-carboxy-1,4-naphthoquinone phytyltransferase, chloroplastic-like n=1 Tax=Primulina huaijiensis TaxID=1492673 RepID=UPI003CC704D0
MYSVALISLSVGTAGAYWETGQYSNASILHALGVFCPRQSLGKFKIKDDMSVGKISPLVWLGTETGSKVVKIKWVYWGIYWLVFAFGLAQTLPYACVILRLTTLPVGNSVVSFVQGNDKDKTKIFKDKYCSVRLHTLFGTALACRLVGTRLLAEQ